MSYRIFCLYATLKGEEPAPWMIAAEDEYAWEGNEERCNRAFQAAREDAERNGWDVREVTLIVPIEAIYRAFEPLEVETGVDG